MRTNKINQRDFQNLEKEIRSEANQPFRQRFYDEMQDISFLDVITKENIENSIKEVGININTKILIVLLCRESKDMYNIDGEVLLNYIDSLSEYDEKLQQKEAQKKRKVVKISNRVTTVDFDKEVKVKDFMKELDQIKELNRDDSEKFNS